MNVSVIDVNDHQKRLQVQIPAPRVREELDERYRELAKRVRIKGFRPGKIPKSIMKSYYGKNIENEVSTQFIQATFHDALREADLKPLVEADVSEMHFDESGAFTYVALVEVSPPFIVEGYRGMTLTKPVFEVGTDQVEAELEKLRQQHAQLRTVVDSRPIADGDVVLLDFIPFVDGEAFEKGSKQDYMVEIGKNAVHPNFDRQLLGHFQGESFSVEVDYEEDAPNLELAGKRVRFDVTIREIKEKQLPQLDDEFAKELGHFETLEDLTRAVRNGLVKREEEKVSAEVRRQIVDQLLGKVQFELSSKVIEREVNYLIDMLLQQFETQGLKLDPAKFNTPEIRAEYRPQADRNVRLRLIFQQIARQENIELNEEELEEIYSEVARIARTDVATVKRDYVDSVVVQNARERRLQEKVFKIIEESAQYTLPAAQGESPHQE